MISMNWAQRLTSDVADFLYPPACLNCGGDIAAGKTRSFCQDCFQKISVPLQNRCERCSAPVGPHVNTASGCLHCKSVNPQYRQTISIGVYEETLKQVCRRCKTRHRRPLTAACSRLLLEQHHATLRDWDVHLVLPVPHHWTDRLRFVDQPAETIAEEFARFLMVPADRHILFKVRRTRKQHELTASARRNNLRGAFQVNSSARLKGLRILITDDVMTTGTTANRLTRLLLDAGAEAVYVAVLARVLLLKSSS